MLQKKHPKLYSKDAMPIALAGIADEPENAFLYSTVSIAMCPAKICPILTRMIEAAEAVSREGDKLEDAADELEGLKRGYEATGPAPGDSDSD